MIEDSPTLIFDFADPLASGSTARRLAFTHPERVIVARTIAEVRPALREVQEASRKGLYAAGMICYEAAPAFDPALRAHTPGPLPLLWFGLFRAPVALPRVTKHHAAVSGWTPDTDRASYDANIVAIRKAIARRKTNTLSVPGIVFCMGRLPSVGATDERHAEPRRATGFGIGQRSLASQRRSRGPCAGELGKKPR